MTRKDGRVERARVTSLPDAGTLPLSDIRLRTSAEVGGLLGSRDSGASWEPLLDGPFVRNNTLDLHGVQVSPAAPGTVYIITQIAMFRGRQYGRKWEHIPLDDMFPGGTYCRGLLVERVYCCAQRGQVYMSHDSGHTWKKTQVPVAMSRSLHIYPMVCG